MQYQILEGLRKNILQEAEMQHHIQNMIAGNNKEIQDFQKDAQQYKAMCTTRGNNDKPALNTENAIQERHSMKNGEMQVMNLSIQERIMLWTIVQNLLILFYGQNKKINIPLIPQHYYNLNYLST